MSSKKSLQKARTFLLLSTSFLLQVEPELWFLLRWRGNDLFPTFVKVIQGCLPVRIFCFKNWYGNLKQIRNNLNYSLLLLHTMIICFQHGFWWYNSGWRYNVLFQIIVSLRKRIMRLKGDIFLVTYTECCRRGHSSQEVRHMKWLIYQTKLIYSNSCIVCNELHGNVLSLTGGWAGGPYKEDKDCWTTYQYSNWPPHYWLTFKNTCCTW